MMHEGKITVELTPEQMEDLIDAATRAAEQDQEDAEILSRVSRASTGRPSGCCWRRASGC